ncbi:hypothetical protein [Anaeroarcus burkinensis]|uniref:hypothetical protein n=1 Tax=Anaeroarcus burkinensis TaxID=82376 RepID=UPI00041F7D39|nr:hypothetical protein [Anaeroarcus burkinensis]
MDSQTISTVAAFVSFISAIITLSVNWIITTLKERKILRVHCRILLSEVEHAQSVFNSLKSNDYKIEDVIPCLTLDHDWDKLKKEHVFGNLNKNEFEILILHYRNIAKIQRIFSDKVKKLELPISGIIDRNIDNFLEANSKARAILEKYSNLENSWSHFISSPKKFLRY